MYSKAKIAKLKQSIQMNVGSNYSERPLFTIGTFSFLKFHIKSQKHHNYFKYAIIIHSFVTYV